ncbi:MAG: hypothetical protein O2904_03730 [bacterium]|nr:hypothetical protein [bacterium]
MNHILEKSDKARLDKEAEMSKAQDAIRIMISRSLSQHIAPLLANRGMGQEPHLGRILHNVDLPVGVWLHTERSGNSIKDIINGARDGLIAFDEEMMKIDDRRLTVISEWNISAAIPSDNDPVARHLIEQILSLMPELKSTPEGHDSEWSEHC